MKMDTSRLEKLPVISQAIAHPRLAAWIVLSLGMIILLVIEARDVGLLATQWLALIVACILVAGACVWIISWESDEDDLDDGAEGENGEEPEVVKSEMRNGDVAAEDGEAASEDGAAQSGNGAAEPEEAPEEQPRA